MNTPVVKDAYSMIQQALSSIVPPCVAEQKEGYHYEVWAVKEGRHLVASVTKHNHSVTLEFSKEIPAYAMPKIFSEYILLKMNDNRRMDLHLVSNELHSDIREAIQALVRYYEEKGWY